MGILIHKFIIIVFILIIIVGPWLWNNVWLHYQIHKEVHPNWEVGAYWRRGSRARRNCGRCRHEHVHIWCPLPSLSRQNLITFYKGLDSNTILRFLNLNPSLFFVFCRRVLGCGCSAYLWEESPHVRFIRFQSWWKGSWNSLGWSGDWDWSGSMYWGRGLSSTEIQSYRCQNGSWEYWNRSGSRRLTPTCAIILYIQYT